MRILRITATAMLLSGVLLAGNALAQTENVAETTAQASETATTAAEPTITSANTDAAVQNSVSTPEPQTKIPGAWGLFWLGLRERMSVALTIDPVKKAEKLVDFANQRMNIAEAVVEKAKDNPALQDQAEKMMARANELMQRVTERKDNLLKKSDEKAQKLLEKAGDQMIHRERVLNKLEEKFDNNRLEKIKLLREEAKADGEKLLNAVGDENVSADVKAHLEEVRKKIEEQREAVKQFVEEKKILLEKIQSGDEQAKEELKKLHEDFAASSTERREEVKALREEAKEVRKEIRQEIKNEKDQLRESAKNGDEDAKDKLKTINEAQKDLRKDMIERKEIRKDVLENRKERREKKLNSEDTVPSDDSQLIIAQ